MQDLETDPLLSSVPLWLMAGKGIDSLMSAVGPHSELLYVSSAFGNLGASLVDDTIWLQHKVELACIPFSQLCNSVFALNVVNTFGVGLTRGSLTIGWVLRNCGRECSAACASRVCLSL